MNNIAAERVVRVGDAQLLEESEALLGLPFFPEDHLLDQEFDAESFGFKEFVYASCRRIIATARAKDRQIAQSHNNYNVATFNDSWRLTLRKMGEIAFRNREQVDFLTRQLALVNGVDAYVAAHWPQMAAQLYKDQQEYMLDVISSLQKPPRSIAYPNKHGETSSHKIVGTTVVAPTGFGKTRLMESCVKMFTPGKRLEGLPEQSRPVRIVIVTPSLLLLSQTKEIMEKALPDVRVGAMHANSHEADADIVLCTIQMFNRYFKSGELMDEPVDVVMVDEAHHLTEPQFRKKFIQEWRGQTIVFTATPAYDIERDVRSILPQIVEKTNLLQCINDGRLNEAQLHTLFIGEEEYQLLCQQFDVADNEKKAAREVIDLLVIEFVRPLLEEGRRGMIFCQPGQQAYWARRLAERLSKVMLQDGTTVQAAAMDSYMNNQREVFEDYKAGKLHVMTTVNTGRQGIDADIDFVIINRSLTSRVHAHQIVGRGTRVSARFPATIYAQIAAPFLHGNATYARQYMLEEMFDKENIPQGRPAHAGAKRQRRALPPTQHSPVLIDDLLQRITKRPIGETLVGMGNKKHHAPEVGAVTLEEMLDGYEVEREYALKLLNEAGFSWQGRVIDVEGTPNFVRYYSPAARDYIHTTLPKGRLWDIQELAVHFGKEAGKLAVIVNNPVNGIQAYRVRPINGRAKKRVFSQVEVEQIRALLAEKSKAIKPGGVKLVEFAAKLNLHPETVWRRAISSKEDHVPSAERYLTFEEAAALEAAFSSIPMATDGDMRLGAIAKAIGTDSPVVAYNMTDAERAAAVEKSCKNARGLICHALHWPSEVAQQVITRLERYRPQPLPPYLLHSAPLRRIVSRFAEIPSSEIAVLLAIGGFEFEEILLPGVRRFAKCLSWQAIEFLEQNLGRKKGMNAMQLNYAVLPKGAEDHDPYRIACAQSIQREYFRRDQLVRVPPR